MNKIRIGQIEGIPESQDIYQDYDRAKILQGFNFCKEKYDSIALGLNTELMRRIIYNNLPIGGSFSAQVAQALTDDADKIIIRRVD